MATTQTDFLVNRLNFDPVVFMGCSEKEIYLVIGSIGVPLCLVCSVLGALLWHNIPFGLLGGFILSIVFVWIAIKAIQRIKRDKEPGYIQQVLLCKLEQRKLYKSPLVCRSGSWLIGRLVE